VTKPKKQDDATTTTEQDGVADAAAQPWKDPDYTGPLTIPQAAWRRAHIKPVQAVTTK
jgi:hypothetical protein